MNWTKARVLLAPINGLVNDDATKEPFAPLAGDSIVVAA
jgi:hypothetical protein